MPAVGDRVVLILDDVEGVVTGVSRPGWFMVDLDGYDAPIEFQASELHVLAASSAQPALTELDDAVLQANGWTITTHTRKTGGQAGGTYQTWLPPRGRKALRSRVEVRRYLASQQRSAPPTPTPAAALPPGVERLLASDAFQLAAAFSGPRGLCALAAAGRALRRVDWAPAWRDLLEARFQLGRLHERTGLERACRRAIERLETDGSWASLGILVVYFDQGTWDAGLWRPGLVGDAREAYRVADGACPILWRGPANVDRSVVPMAGVEADQRFLPAAQALGVRFFFGEPFSRRHNTAAEGHHAIGTKLHFKFTATDGPSGGLLDCAYVGLCVKPVADDASCQVQELDATFISSAGFGYGATLEGGSTSPVFLADHAIELSIQWNDRGEVSAQCKFMAPRAFTITHNLNLRRLLRRDAGTVGLVPVIGVPRGAKAAIAAAGYRWSYSSGTMGFSSSSFGEMTTRRSLEGTIEQFRSKVRQCLPALREGDDSEGDDDAGDGMVVMVQQQDGTWRRTGPATAE